MATLSPHDNPETNDLLQRARQRDMQAIGELLGRDSARLRRMVGIRLDPRIQSRISPSDVVQEAHLEATERLAEFLRNPSMPFFLWLRLITAQRVLALHRQHLQSQQRDARREDSINGCGLPQATSAALAARLMGRVTSPREAAIRAEIKARLRTAPAR